MLVADQLHDSIGYLPTDASGECCYQLIDICSCCILAWLTHQVLEVKRKTYQAEEDSLKVFPFVVCAVILAILFHADMNRLSLGRKYFLLFSEGGSAPQTPL